VYGDVAGRVRIDYLPGLGKGALRTIDFGDRQGRQVQTFTCGHEVETPVDATE
jgi:hypothetical protein